MTTSESPFGYRDALQILELVEASSSLETLSLKIGSVELELERSSAPRGAEAPLAQPAAAPVPTAEEPTASEAVIDQSSSDDIDVTSAMAGVFYRAPKPGDPPFVSVGDHIEEGQTIGIVEVMKLMSTIPSPVAGTVTAIVGQDSQPIEFGAVILRVRPDEAGVANG